MIKILLVEDDLSLSNSVFDFLDDFADVMQVFDGYACRCPLKYDT